MKNYEISLVIFTVLSQMAVGLAIFTAWQTQRLGATAVSKAMWGYVTVTMGTALAASLFHLGHPLQAYTALANLGVAWLSAEILFGGTFAGLAALAFITGGRPIVGFAAALVGVVFVAIQGFTYAPLAQTALANGLPLAFFALTVWILGAAGWRCLHADPGQSGLNLQALLKTGLWVWLAIMLIAPCIWAAGGTVMRQTALNWGASWLYWGAIIITVASLALLTKRPQTHPAPVAAALLCASVLGRLTFFGETASTFAHMGAPF